MNPPKVYPFRRTLNGRSRYVSLLQIAGTLAIITFHIGFGQARGGWMAVELFFVLAGFNMVQSIESKETAFSYGCARAWRLVPEVSVVWGLTLILLIFGVKDAEGLKLFAVSAPLFLENLIFPFLSYRFSHPVDWIWGPLWFVGALMQLQLLMFGLRKLLNRKKPAFLLGFSFLLGSGFRLAASMAFGDGHPRELNYEVADILYCLPLTHIEAIVCGYLLGRGLLPRIGKYLPVWLLITALAGFVNMRLGDGIPKSTMGFPMLMRFNYQYIWGYALLALTGASLCSPAGALPKRVEMMQLPFWADCVISGLSSMTYSAYIFHGCAIGAAHYLSNRPDFPFASCSKTMWLLMAVTGSFFAAWVFKKARHFAAKFVSKKQ
jgi:hypothetical protein